MHQVFVAFVNHYLPVASIAHYQFLFSFPSLHTAALPPPRICE
jgi:hypothetical protein